MKPVSDAIATAGTAGTSPAVELIGSSEGLAAILLPQPVTRDQRDALYQLLNQQARANVSLARAWGLHAVLASEDWKPSARPKGLRLLFT